jgi:short-subunit dehydrogenase
LVLRYAQVLQHRLIGTGVKFVLIKPGYPNDRASKAARRPSLANVEDVAQLIFKGLYQGKSIIYSHAKWALVMMIIRNLPNIIFNNLEI